MTSKKLSNVTLKQINDNRFNFNHVFVCYYGKKLMWTLSFGIYVWIQPTAF